MESFKNWNRKTIKFSPLLLFISIFLFKVTRSWIVGGSGDQCGIHIGLPASSSWRLGHKSPFQHSGAQTPFSPLAESPPPSSSLASHASRVTVRLNKKRLLCFPSPCLSPRQRTEGCGLNEITVCMSAQQCVWFLHLNPTCWVQKVDGSGPTFRGCCFCHYCCAFEKMYCFKFTLSILNTTKLVAVLNIQPLLTVFVILLLMTENNFDSYLAY